MDGRKYKWTEIRTDRNMDRQTYRQVDGHRDGQTIGLTDGPTDPLTNKGGSRRPEKSLRNWIHFQGQGQCRIKVEGHEQ